MKKKLSKGENDFIIGCTRAILQNDTSHHHWLFVIGGVKKYVSHKDETYPENHPIFKNSRCICAIGKEFITDWHDKAGKDDLSKPWLKRSLEKMLANSESFAELYYSADELKKLGKDGVLKSIKTDGLSKEGKDEYLKKVTTLIRS
jgi:hypothetical protein